MLKETELNKLYRYGISLTNNDTDAYDLLQDALERYLKSEIIIQDNALIGYIRRTMRNRFIDQLRHQQRFPLESIELHTDTLTEHDIDHLENTTIKQQQLELIWDQLNPFEREILHLWAIEEFTAKEIAQQLDSPRGTILSRIHRLRKKIEQFVESSDTSTSRGQKK